MDFFNFDLAGFFSFTVSPLELVFRGPLMYWLRFTVFRLTLRRDVGSPGIDDFLRVVVLGKSDCELKLVWRDQPKAAA